MKSYESHVNKIIPCNLKSKHKLQRANHLLTHFLHGKPHMKLTHKAESKPYVNTFYSEQITYKYILQQALHKFCTVGKIPFFVGAALTFFMINFLETW